MSEPLDFTLPRFFVFIIESNKITEIRQGFSEGNALRNVLKFSGVISEYRTSIMKMDFANSIAWALTLAQ